jgi:hypothetical protein
MAEIDDSRQAGAIEVTPAMIEAGVTFLLSSGRLRPRQPEAAVAELVEELLEEIFSVACAEDPGSHGARATPRMLPLAARSFVQRD